MARCLAGFCGCVADTILMVSRAILFITCVLLGIGQAAWLLLPHKLDEQHLQTPARLYGGYIATGILLAVSLMGIHGAYTRDPRNLKIVSHFRDHHEGELPVHQLVCITNLSLPFLNCNLCPSLP